jgi:hypothetical protein
MEMRMKSKSRIAADSQCVDALFQPVDLSLNSFEPFALVDLPPVLEYANRAHP